MSLHKKIFIRYRDAGHVRFDLPPELCEATAADSLVSQLRRLEGVYRIDFSPKRRKLSLRYAETVIDFTDLARNLGEIVDQIQDELDSFSTLPGEIALLGEELRNSRPFRWLKDKYEEIRETAEAAAILVKAGRSKSATRLMNPDFVIDFFTDILVLYLIKMHWRLILDEWMRKPLSHKSEWSAAFYMIFLLVRSRMPKSN